MSAVRVNTSFGSSTTVRVETPTVAVSIDVRDVSGVSVISFKPGTEGTNTVRIVPSGLEVFVPHAPGELGGAWVSLAEVQAAMMGGAH